MDRRSLLTGLASTSALLSAGKLRAQDGTMVLPPDPSVADRIAYKAKHYDEDFHDDAYLDEAGKKMMLAVLGKLSYCRKTVGFGNFNILSFDDLLKIVARGPAGAFDAAELKFLEGLFYRDARDYGFYGQKVSTQLTERILTKNAVKMPGTGHYVYRGSSEELYHELKKDVGEDILLTSGIRSVVKQIDLFLSKTAFCNGNLSKASRSLAPPGYSFHGIGDFDVGKIGLGADNFTDTFASTDVYKRLIDLGYVNIRYHEGNAFGVRFEPWHIKVIA